MAGVMAKVVSQTDNSDLVLRARMEADALGELYELYYERIFRFCVHRLFSKEAAEDVTSTVFLEVARRIRAFEGRGEQDFRNWLYRIASNQANAYIRKVSRRSRLLAKAASSAARAGQGTGESSEGEWPRLYAAILKLRPEQQTILTLRFFENLSFEEIGRILNAKKGTLRVTVHRIINQLRNSLETVPGGER
jgi:RNA polymerase sigma-70 factor (ECF subfamily)